MDFKASFSGKHLLRNLSGLLLLLLVATVSPAQSLWQPKGQSPDAESQSKAHYGLYTLDYIVFRNLLSKAPVEHQSGKAGEVSVPLPRPDGTLVAFAFEETHLTTVTDPAVQAVKTYTGYNAARTVTAHLTVYGNQLWALIMEGSYTWFVSSPHQSGIDGIEVYDQQGLPFKSKIPGCGAEGQRIESLEEWVAPTSPVLNRNAAAPCSLKIYRLAIAGAADYTAYFGNNPATAFANTVAIINNLNALYERDMGIRFNLVTTSSLMYTDTATDPFVNQNTSACSQLSISHTNFTNVVGNANYDLGITFFGQNIGGCAYAPSACNSGYKGGAAGGYDVPTPTSYLLTVAAHEIGHQFSAGHSHNTNGSGCQYSTNSSWEPGGGSTIMAYTGCSPSFESYNTGIYFHGGTLGQMRNYITTASGNCYTAGASNMTPAITTPTDDTFFIPVSTPFKLSATVIDSADANTLLYSFEQMDLGTGSTLPPADTTSFGPIIRSFEPSPKAYRYVPRMDSIVANVTPVFERLPSISRSIRFWGTVRDNRSGCGCTSVDTIQIKTTGSTPFRVTSQNTAITTSTGSTVTVTWNVANTAAAPFNTANVQILFAGDGLNYNTVLAASTPNDGSQSVTLPNIATTHGRIMVAAIGNVFFDINNANITLQPTCADVQTSQIFPEEDLYAPAGDPALQLTLTPVFGVATDSLSGNITATDPTGRVGAKTSPTDTTCDQSLSGRYDLYKFMIVRPGAYNVSLTRYTLGNAAYFALYNANGYSPANVCNNYLFRTNNFYDYNSSGSRVNYYYNSFDFTGLPLTIYHIPFNGYSSAGGTYKLTVSGPGGIYTEFKNPATSYGYVVVDTAGTIRLVSTTQPDLRTLRRGVYYIYGVSYSPGLNLAGYQNQPFSTLETGTFPSGTCASISNNRKRVVVNSGTPLTIASVYLKATAGSTGNTLTWQVANELEADRALVEYSPDGQTFTVLAELDKGQNRVGTAGYRYIHDGPVTQTSSYRIRQYDTRGSYLYSNVAVVQNTARDLITVSPNPTHDKITLTVRSLTSLKPFTVQLYDSKGRLVATYEVTTSSYQIDLAALPAGLYLLSGEGIRERIVKY